MMSLAFSPKLIFITPSSQPRITWEKGDGFVMRGIYQGGVRGRGENANLSKADGELEGLVAAERAVKLLHRRT